MEAVVEYEYKAEQEDELNLKVGEIITNVITAEGGWWEGELNGKKGMFPENFVKLVRRRDQPTSKKEEKREATQRKSVRELASKFKDGVPMGGPPKKKDKKKKCKVLFEYKKENDDELDLGVGDIIDFHKQVEEGWWEGTLNGKHGVFPSNFVEMIEENTSSDESAPISSISEEKEKPSVPADAPGSKDGEIIKGKKVVGVGLGNIFGGGPIKLRSTAESAKKDDSSKSGKPNESEAAPEVAKREKPNAVERAIVRFSYAAEQPDELSLTEGQMVRIIERDLEDEGWWKGEVNGKIGVFPDNFVELLPAEEPNKPKKPPPPSANAKHNLHPKLPEKSPQVDSSDEKLRTEPQGPSVGKKPHAPPPIGKKPFGQKSTDTKPETVLATRPTGSAKDKISLRENHADTKNSEEAFDGMKPSTQKLTHPTIDRPKGPKDRRPPSMVAISNEGEKENGTLEDIKSAMPLRLTKVIPMHLRNTMLLCQIEVKNLTQFYPPKTINIIHSHHQNLSLHQYPHINPKPWCTLLGSGIGTHTQEPHHHGHQNQPQHPPPTPLLPQVYK